MTSQQNTQKHERKIDRMLRELGENLHPVIDAFMRDYVPVSPWTAIRRAEAERRMRDAETAFRAGLREGASPMPRALDASKIQRIRGLYASEVDPADTALHTEAAINAVARRSRMPR